MDLPNWRLNVFWIGTIGKGIKFAALRYFNAAGYDVERIVTGLEQNPANLMPVIMEVACGRREKLVIFGDDYTTKDGTCIRDYIHVNDLGVGHLQALDYLVKAGKSLTVNLATGVGHSVLDVYQKTKECTGIDIPVLRLKAGLANVPPDNHRLRNPLRSTCDTVVTVIAALKRKDISVFSRDFLVDTIGKMFFESRKKCPRFGAIFPHGNAGPADHIAANSKEQVTAQTHF